MVSAMRRVFLPLLGWSAISLVYAATPAIHSSIGPLAIREVNPAWLSSGVFAALAADGAFGTVGTKTARLAVNGAPKGQPPAILDARVGANIRLGTDPAVLPASQNGQAEPHVYRSASNPLTLLATFQEGRFSDAGSLDCGYSVSRDGGLTWTRALIPQLTASSGGTYNRATDPVAAIGPQGDMYLNTLGSISGAFDLAAVVVSRSTDNGATWIAPVTVFRSTSTQVMPDKEWIAVNDFPNSPNAARLVVTWTNFTSNSSGASTGNNLLAATSDDRGTTWSSPVAITPQGANNQGSQPVFFPDGTLGVVYVTFANSNTETLFSIDFKRSIDGGRTFPATSTTVVPSVTGWDDPELREGIFLPSATVARNSGDLFVTYVAVVNGTPRVMVTKSSDKGGSWTAPVIASDNPTDDAVMNPAIATTPDGRTVSVVFLDKRNAGDGANYLDLYAAQSFDGGQTWQPNIRLSDITSDIRYAPQTTRGYMLGDYLGVAPSLAADEPCVAIWCDTRAGNSDPFTVRFIPAATANYDTWRLARAVGPGSDDPDQDGVPNVLEYALGTDPNTAETGDTLVLNALSNGDVIAAIAVRNDLQGDITLVGTTNDGNAVALQSTPDARIAPSVIPPAGLAWRTFSIHGLPQGTRLSPAMTTYTDALDARTPGLQVSSTEMATIGTDSRLINVSSRGVVGAGMNQMIVGFVLDGQKTMLIRATGPALAAFGVSNTLTHPQLTLTPQGNSAAVLATNTAWQQSGASSDLFARLGAFPFAAGSSDAAIVPTLGAGGYTAVVSGVNGETGAAMVEAYDADPVPGDPAGARILDLSTRGPVGATDATALIGGFVINGTQPRRILIRAVGPTLSQFSVTGVLADPVLRVYQRGAVIAANDDWQITRSRAAVAATAQRVGAFSLNAASLDASLLLTLAPGLYTANITGYSGTTGVALVEVYDAN
jgi:hypothetical protein